jgi:2-oxoglutarate ferredoxin oxidoreductase subunit alpha
MIEDVRLALEGAKPIHFLNRVGGMLVSPDVVVEKIRAIEDGSSTEVSHA